MTITHRAFFGDGDRDFTLTDPMVIELERQTDTGIGALFLRLTRSDFRLADLTQIIRLGLIGAGTTPQEASRLVETYGQNRPLSEVLPLALARCKNEYSDTPRRLPRHHARQDCARHD